MAWDLPWSLTTSELIRARATGDASFGSSPKARTARKVPSLSAGVYASVLDRARSEGSWDGTFAPGLGALDWVSGKGVGVGLLGSLGKALRKVVSSPIAQIGMSFIPGVGGIAGKILSKALPVASKVMPALSRSGASPLAGLLQGPVKSLVAKKLGAGGKVAQIIERVRPGVGQVFKVGASAAVAAAGGAAGGDLVRRTRSGDQDHLYITMEDAQGFAFKAKASRKKGAGRMTTSRRRKAKRRTSRRSSIRPKGGSRRYSKKQLANMKRFARMARSRRRKRRN